jgi:hypothetical protein
MTVRDIVTAVQLIVLGQKGRPGEWIKYEWTLQSGSVWSLLYLTTISCHVLLLDYCINQAHWAIIWYAHFQPVIFISYSCIATHSVCLHDVVMGNCNFTFLMKIRHGRTCPSACSECRNWSSYISVHLFGVFVDVVLVHRAVLERNAVLLVPWSTWQVVGLLLGFGVAKFLFSVLSPVVLRDSGATALHLSLLTADFYWLVLGIILLQYKVKSRLPSQNHSSIYKTLVWWCACTF